MTTPTNVLSKHCPSQSVLEMVTGKWTVLVLYALRGKTRRYSELERVIDGISQKMLTQTLRDLERNGLVERTVYPVVPPHTEYRLTGLGAGLEGTVTALGTWAQDHLNAVLSARQEYDERSAARR
jgi:DNA-binding HxlR family transcriptional regulator